MRFRDSLDRELYYSSQIDFCYWRIQEMSKHTGKMESPLNALIDKATGFDIANTLENITVIRSYVSCIARCKKALGYDPRSDKDFLKKLNEIRKSLLKHDTV
jgi:hypothetical protein